MKILETIEKYILYTLVATFAIFVLSPFPAVYVTPKLALLTVGVALIAILRIIRAVVKGSINFSSGKFDLAVVILSLAYLISTFVIRVNKMEAFFYPGAVSFILAGALLYFLINQLKNQQKEGIATALVVSGVLLSLSHILTVTQVFSKIPQLPAFVKDVAFYPLGGVLPTIIYLVAISPLLVGLFVKQKDIAKRALLGISGVLIVLALILSIKNILPGAATLPRLMTFKNSWQVLIDTLKVSPVWGSGPANYLTAFNRFRPLDFNQSDLWALKFTSSRDFYFSLITEIGLAGLFALSLLLIAVYKFVIKNIKITDFEKISLLTLLIAFALFPASPALIVLMFILLAINSDSGEKTLELSGNRMSTGLLTAPLILGIIALGYFGERALFAEYRFKKALEALTANKAQETYNNLREAVRVSPNVDRYHASFSQVDMALASGIASKKEITDTDRTTVSQLIQHAINEGKITVTLNPTRSGNWELLAQIYRAIMPFAQGADQFTVQVYTQAVALDPLNPNLRIALGGVYYALGRFDNAIDTFKLATLAKPDLANAHYNLAVAYREKKDYTKATDEMNTVLSLVGKDSADYETALKELKNIEGLAAPQPAEESKIKPPLELPKEATPPATLQ